MAGCPIRDATPLPARPVRLAGPVRPGGPGGPVRSVRRVFPGWSVGRVSVSVGAPHGKAVPRSPVMDLPGPAGRLRRWPARSGDLPASSPPVARARVVAARRDDAVNPTRGAVHDRAETRHQSRSNCVPSSCHACPRARLGKTNRAAPCHQLSRTPSKITALPSMTGHPNSMTSVTPAKIGGKGDPERGAAMPPIVVDAVLPVGPAVDLTLQG